MVQLKGLTERWKARLKERDGQPITMGELTGGMCSGEAEEYSALVDARLFLSGAGHPKREDFMERYGVPPEDVVTAFRKVEE